jgi:NADH-quinone oxidoreductase subunit G
MVELTINGQSVHVPEETTIMQAAKSADINIPSLCYFEGLNEIGACRICAVEIEGVDRLVTACNTRVEEGMAVHTDSLRARTARSKNIQLILSQHDCHCPPCVRNGNCELQKIAGDLNILEFPYHEDIDHKPADKTTPIIRDEDKCIKCMRCIQVCEQIQSIGVWDISGTGGGATVGVSGKRTLAESNCVFCGQCVTHCPTGALSVRDDTARVLKAMEDLDKTTIVQVAPAVRSSWAEAFGLTRAFASPKRMAAALRRLGFDYVFDTNFAADLTIMEEGSEFLKRFTNKDQYAWPMFTSCCSGWVRFVKSQYPELTRNLSSAKSPQQMFGAVAKTYFADKKNIDPLSISFVSVMPCSAKKSECRIPTMKDACGGSVSDVDVVITTREFDRMLRQKGIDPSVLPEEDFDSPLGTGTGAAVIFGATGGVMDAALRSAYFLVTGKNPDADAFTAVRGMDGWKEAVFNIPGAGDVRVAVVSGLANARKLIEAVKRGEAVYDFVEVMACPGGCAGGGGQPITAQSELADVRGEILWQLDKKSAARYSHENPDVQALYKEFLGEPLSKEACHLLHTDHSAWDIAKK